MGSSYDCLVGVQYSAVKAGEDNIHTIVRMSVEPCGAGEQSNACCFFHGIAVSASRNSRESDAVQVMLIGKVKAVLIAVRELQTLRCNITVSVINRADSMNNVASRKVVAEGNFRSACSAAVQVSAFVQQLRASSAVNRSVYAAAT